MFEESHRPSVESIEASMPSAGSSGPALASAVSAVQVADASGAELIELMQATERLASWVSSVQLQVISEFARRRPDRSGEFDGRGGRVSEFAQDEIAVALRLSRQAAGGRLGLAIALDRLPGTFSALRDGAIDLPRARVLAEGVSALGDDLAQAVEQQLLPSATHQTTGQLRARTARVVLAVAPYTAQERHEQARQDRRVILTPAQDGMSELWALLPAAEAATLYTALNVLANAATNTEADADADACTAHPGANTPNSGECSADVGGECTASAGHGADAGCDLHSRTSAPGAEPQRGDLQSRSSPARRDDRTIDQRRADVLIDLARLAHDEHRLNQVTATPSRSRPDIRVLVPFGTLLGISEEPAHLAGYGPIDSDTARRLAADGTWRRLLTDPLSGTILDVGRRSYRPPADLTDYIQLRDQTCRFPGCRYPAHRSDLDHTIPYPIDTTRAGNLAALCRHHHRLKTHTTWQVQQHADAQLTWTSPTDHSYTTTAADHRVVIPAHAAALSTGPSPRACAGDLSPPF